MIIPIEAAVEGDLIFCHSTGVISRAIRMAEWVRWRKGSTYNHVAILDVHQLDGWSVIQAESRGVTRGAKLSTIAPGGTYSIVGLPTGCNRAEVLAFARAQVGRRYGFVTIVSCLLTILTPGAVNFMLGSTWICSAVAAESLRCGGWIHDWPDLYQCTPAQLWEALP